MKKVVKKCVRWGISHSKVLVAILVVIATMGTVAAVSNLWYNPEEAKVSYSSVSQTEEQSSIKEDNPDEPWVVYPWKSPNTLNNVGDGDALSGETAKDYNTMLSEAEHLPEALRGYAIQFGAIDKQDIGAELVEKAENGKTYINEKGRAIFYRLKAKLASMKAESTTIDSDIIAHNSGVDDKAGFVVDSKVRNFKGQKALKFTDEQNQVEYYVLDYCGNGLFPTGRDYGVPKKELPTPPKPKNTTPPPTVPGNKLEPKKAELIPDAKVGGGKNINPGVDGPATETAPSFQESYQAPAAPSASSNAATSSSGAFSSSSTVVGGNTYHNNIHNSSSGSFSDVNGETKMESNGAVSSPRGNYSPLVGTTPPAPTKNAQPSSSPITDDIDEPE